MQRSAPGAPRPVDLDEVDEALAAGQYWLEQSHVLPAAWLARLLQAAGAMREEISLYRAWAASYVQLLSHPESCPRCADDYAAACDELGALLEQNRIAWSRVQELQQLATFSRS